MKSQVFSVNRGIAVVDRTFDQCYDQQLQYVEVACSIIERWGYKQDVYIDKVNSKLFERNLSSIMIKDTSRRDKTIILYYSTYDMKILKIEVADVSFVFDKRADRCEANKPCVRVVPSTVRATCEKIAKEIEQFNLFEND